jgi:hypothetical protein
MDDEADLEEFNHAYHQFTARLDELGIDADE